MLMLVFAFLLAVGGSLAVFHVPMADAQALSEEEKAKLRVEYDQLQVEITEWERVLAETRQKKNSLQGDVTELNAQIKKAETEIKQRNNTISRLAGEINEKVSHIASLEERLFLGEKEGEET